MSQKKYFFQKCFWLKLNNMGLSLGMTLKMYASVAKGFKLKFRTFLGLMRMLVIITIEKLVEGGGLFSSSIRNYREPLTTNYFCVSS